MISLSRKTGLRAINAKEASPLLPSKLIEIMHPNPINISIRKARFKFLYFKINLLKNDKIFLKDVLFT